MTDLANLDAIGQAELVRRGEVTALELVEAAIRRIEAINSTINAVVTPLFDEAGAEAAASHKKTGPLAGVPYLLKDLGTGQAGVLQTAGSRAFRDHRPGADSPLVSAYKAAGLVIV